MRLDLVRDTLVRRYKRFFADVVLADGRTVVAHVPNTGSMATLLHPGGGAWLLPATNPLRKLQWTLVLLELPGSIPGQDPQVALVDTGLPNRLAEAAVAAQTIPDLAGYRDLRREVVYGTRGSRCDLWLDGHADRPSAVIEVKNITMAAGPERADFPDSPSERGTKHLLELTDQIAAGRRGVQLYLAGRTDTRSVGLAAGIDPTYARTAVAAQQAGVEFLAHALDVTWGAASQDQRQVELRMGRAVPFVMPTL